MILFLLGRKRRWGLLSGKCYQTLYKCSHLKRIKGNVIRQWIYSGELYQATQCRLNEALRPFWKKYNNSINQFWSPVIYGGHPAPLWRFFPLPCYSCLRQAQGGGEIASAFLPYSHPLSHTMPFCSVAPIPQRMA